MKKMEIKTDIKLKDKFKNLKISLFIQNNVLNCCFIGIEKRIWL